MQVESYKIESKSETDTYLTDLFATAGYRTMIDIETRATMYIIDPDLRRYFLERASDMLYDAEPSS